MHRANIAFPLSPAQPRHLDHELAARGEPVALVTFALYSPLGTDEWLKTRTWGYPKMIEQDVAAHNDVLRRIGGSASMRSPRPTHFKRSMTSLR